MSKFNKTPNYKKPYAAYDLESMKHNYAVGVRVNGKTFVAFGGLTIPYKIDGVEYISLNQLKSLTYDNMFYGFNNKHYDDYVIKSILAGDSAEAVNELSRKLISTSKPAFLWDNAPKSLFGTFDIKQFVGSGVSLKQLLSQAGKNVLEYDIDFNLQRPLTRQEFTDLIRYMINDVEGTEFVFNTNEIQSVLQQHISSIEHYLPGKDGLISSSDSSLATSAMTNGSKLIAPKKQKFTWELNGHYVLDFMPEQWRNELLSYASRLEEAMVSFNEKTASQVDVRSRLNAERVAGKEILKAVEAPVIEPIKLSDTFIVKPALGGLHSKVIDAEGNAVVSRAVDVHHRDISGAYGMLALATNLFGDQITKTYKGFMDDKFAAKKQGNKGLIAASKLMTNAPTGNADQPGSPLYNPIGITENRVMLQVLLYQAAKEITEAGGSVLSINTDGLFYTGDEDVIAPVVHNWEKFWGFTLGYEHIDGYIAKDDNNRILIQDNQIVEQSGEIGHMHFNPKQLGALPRIVDYAVTTKITNEGRSIEDIVDSYIAKNRTDLFAWTLKATRNHKTVINYEIAQTVNRVFLTLDGDEIGNYSVTKDSIEAFTNKPVSKVKLINEQIPDVLPENINRDAYIEIIKTVYSHWQK